MDKPAVVERELSTGNVGLLCLENNLEKTSEGGGGVWRVGGGGWLVWRGGGLGGLVENFFFVWVIEEVGGPLGTGHWALGTGLTLASDKGVPRFHERTTLP